MSVETLAFNPKLWASQLLALPEVRALLEIAEQAQQPVYLVGGAVRDLLYTQSLSTDLDWVVPAGCAKPWAEKLAEKIEGRCILLDADFGIYRVVFPQSNLGIDLADCVGADINEDLGRRDYTVNAMAFDLVSHELLDPFGGQADLQQGVLRMISEKNLLEDPLRLLRFFRFKAQLNLPHSTPETLTTIQHHAPKTLRVAVERIQYEWLKLLSAPRCFETVNQMRHMGVLELFFPELSAMHAVPPNRYHHLGLMDHTLELLNQFEIHFPDLPEDVQTHLLSDWTPGVKRLAVVRLSCLFHDVAKPATMAYDPVSGKTMFYGHDLASAEVTWGIAQRYRWGRDLTKIVCDLVRWHLYPGNVIAAEVTQKARHKFFRRVDAFLPELIALSIADRFSAQGPDITQEELLHKKHGLNHLWTLYQTYLQSDKVKTPRLLSGEQVMDILGLSPGPQIGKLLAQLDEAYLNDEFTTEEEAINWLKQWT